MALEHADPPLTIATMNKEPRTMNRPPTRIYKTAKQVVRFSHGITILDVIYLMLTLNSLLAIDKSKSSPLILCNLICLQALI